MKEINYRNQLCLRATCDLTLLPNMDVSDTNSNGNPTYVLLEKNGRFVLSDMCRLCGHSNKNFVSIYEGEGLTNDLGRKIETYLPIQVTTNDCLPQQVCCDCANTVFAWHNLVENSSKVEEKFREILEAVVVMKNNFQNEREVTPATFEYPENQQFVPCTENTKGKVSITDGGIARSQQKNVQREESGRSERSAEKDSESSLNKPMEYHDVFLNCSSETNCEQKCKHCEFCFNAKNELTTHIVKSSTEYIFHCNQCDKLLKKKSDLLVHMNCHYGTGENENEWCRSCYTDELQNTCQSVLPEDHSYCSADSSQKPPKECDKTDLTCPICECSFYRKVDLKRHFKMHSSENPNSKKPSKSTVAYIDSVLYLQEAKTYHCEKCGRNFTSKDSYVRHSRIHTGEKPFTCDICGKQFRDGGGLRRHLRDVHDGIKKFGCDICGRCFASKATRDDHRRIHTGERPYICDSCGKTFKSKASLYIHSKIHTDEFPHNCTYCNKSFRRKQELLNHTTTHTGEKSHICEICGKSFGVKGEMLRHKITHSDDRPFVCKVCGLGFKQKRYLRNHDKIHKKN